MLTLVTGLDVGIKNCGKSDQRLLGKIFLADKNRLWEESLFVLNIVCVYVSTGTVAAISYYEGHYPTQDVKALHCFLSPIRSCG
jgi:hypothetical protein